MIIGIAGRISSGKRVLCNVLEKHGYQRIYFALPLKTLLTTLLRLPSIQKLDELKNVEREYEFWKEDYNYIAKETGIPLNFILDKMSNQKFTTVRQLLQYVGTDVIRAFNPDWHLNKIKEMMSPYRDYVIDDLRFPNEKKFIESLHGDTWYVCRPKIDNVINHISETSLQWQDFDKNVIINDKSQEVLEFKWDTFVENYQDHMVHRMGVIESLNREKVDISQIADPFSTFDMFILHKDQFAYKPKTWDKDNIQNYQLDNTKNLIITYNDSTVEYVQNRLNIEDFKKLI